MASNREVIVRAVALIFGAVMAFIVVIGVLWFSFAAIHRYQARANATNRIKVYERNLKTTKIQAMIRYQQSIGIRESQDEIAKTLTPLYVAFEMTQAMQAIATSGKNNSLVYIPTSPTTGLPVVPTSNVPPKP